MSVVGDMFWMRQRKFAFWYRHLVAAARGGKDRADLAAGDGGCDGQIGERPAGGGQKVSVKALIVSLRIAILFHMSPIILI